MEAPSSEMRVGDTQTLSVTDPFSDISDMEVSFKSDNPDVLAVDSHGNVLGIAPGEATVTVSTEDGSKSGSCLITVSAPSAIPVKRNNPRDTLFNSNWSRDTLSTNPLVSLKLDKSSISMTEGNEKLLSASIEPTSLFLPDFSWNSSDENVVKVQSYVYKGKSVAVVKALNAGNATVTVSLPGNEKTARCEVTVSAPVHSGITLDHYQLTIAPNSYNSLEATVETVNGITERALWKSNNSNVIRIDTSDGLFHSTGVIGDATVTAQTKSGMLFAKCEVAVRNYAFCLPAGEESYVFDLTPETFPIPLGENIQGYGDGLKIVVEDGTGIEYYDGDVSHYSIEEAYNDGCIKASIEREGPYYYYYVSLKKPGNAKIRLVYENGPRISQDIEFEIFYRDGSDRMKFVTFNRDSRQRNNFEGNMYAYKGDGLIYFGVTDLLGYYLEDLDPDHYIIENLSNNGVVSASKISQEIINKQKHYLICLRLLKSGEEKMRITYTDGQNMITTGEFTVTVM